MFSRGIFFFVPLLAFCLNADDAQSPGPERHYVVPLKKTASEQWVERVWGDPDKSGSPYVIRIHNDAGYVVLPHVHPEDENITVVQGSWSLGMGNRFIRSALEPLELGAFGIVPKKMAHFARSKTETIIQVHGIGPFSTTVVDPVYELTDKGVLSKISLLQPGRAAQSSPPDCFALKIGDRVRGAAGAGVVVGALCSPANQLTQYWIQKPNNERFWATLGELKHQ
jgi:hypothetical protein